ncbi:hypothetical protein NW768_003627 [Fusarium equiseti]|uniref:Uncharacterized protein n=2 Tax=Fusarium incarnatum-equiseti species complex TaxID=450425 RepID=A0ABQ8RI68_FUSEQ|nr:hypothetical protein NW768_003627 [Fusarium equiseti]
MPGKSSDWDNADFLLDLVVGLYTGAQTNKGLTPAIKDSIEEYLKSRGYSTSFDAVRCDFLLFANVGKVAPCLILSKSKPGGSLILSKSKPER